MIKGITIDLCKGRVAWGDSEASLEIEDAGSEGTIVGISVPRSHRRKGIGTALVRALEDASRGKGLQRLVVPSTPSRQALSFWLSCGFSYVFPEDACCQKRILCSQSPEDIFDNGAGVILLHKVL